MSCVAFILLGFAGHISTPPSKRTVSNIHTDSDCESVQEFCNLFTENYFFHRRSIFNFYFSMFVSTSPQKGEFKNMVIVVSVKPQGKSQSSWDFRIFLHSPNFHNFILWPSCHTHICVFVWQIDFNL